MKDLEEFIEIQLRMLKQDFSKAQIRDNVYRRVFSNGIPNITINAMIDNCMELYSEITIRNQRELLNNDKDPCGGCKKQPSPCRTINCKFNDYFK